MTLNPADRDQFAADRIADEQITFHDARCAVAGCGEQITFHDERGYVVAGCGATIADEHDQLIEAALAMAATIRVELLQAGDVAVFRFDAELDRELSQRIADQLEARLGPDIPLIVIGRTVELLVLRQAAAERLGLAEAQS